MFTLSIILTRGSSDVFPDNLHVDRHSTLMEQQQYGSLHILEF